jgi:hypothetical protein
MCKKRFAGLSHIEYHVNDGKSLQFLADSSIDFVFSFDSLVHAEADVIDIYLRQLSSKLTVNGTGFIHHSNLGSFVDPQTHTLPPEFENPHWRSETMSAEIFKECAENAGLRCLAQEKVNWGSDRLTDAFSVFTRRGSSWIGQNQIMENPQFMAEAAYISRLAQIYGRKKVQRPKS